MNRKELIEAINTKQQVDDAKRAELRAAFIEHVTDSYNPDDSLEMVAGAIFETIAIALLNCDEKTLAKIKLRLGIE